MVYLEAYVVKEIVKSFEKGTNKVSFEEAMKELGFYKEDGQVDKKRLASLAKEAAGKDVKGVFELVEGKTVDRWDKNSPIIAIVDTATLAKPEMYHLLSFSKPDTVDVRKGKKKGSPETIVFTLMDFNIFYYIPDEEELEYRKTWGGYCKTHCDLAKFFMRKITDEIYNALNEGEYKEKFLALWICLLADLFSRDGSMIPFKHKHIDTHKLVDFED